MTAAPGRATAPSRTAGTDGEDSGASPLVENPARAPAPTRASGAGRIDIHA